MPSPYNQPGMPGTWGPINWAPMNNAPTTWAPYQTYSGTGSHLAGAPGGMYPPQPPRTHKVQTPSTNVIKVSGPESAKAFPTEPNSEIAMFDASHPIFYWKITDEGGYCGHPRAFKFEEIEIDWDNLGSVQMEKASASRIEKDEFEKTVNRLDEKIDGAIAGFAETVKKLSEQVDGVEKMLEGLVS